MFQGHVVLGIDHHHHPAGALEERAASLMGVDPTSGNSVSPTGVLDHAPGPDRGALVVGDHDSGETAGMDELARMPRDGPNPLQAGLHDSQESSPAGSFETVGMRGYSATCAADRRPGYRIDSLIGLGRQYSSQTRRISYRRNVSIAPARVFEPGGNTESNRS